MESIRLFIVEGKPCLLKNQMSLVLILAMFEDENKVLKTDVSSYLSKETPNEKIDGAMVPINRRESAIERRFLKKILKYFSQESDLKSIAPLLGERDKKNLENKGALTLRELECLQMVAKGLSNNEAASVLNLSRATIRTHLEHIYQKLDVTNRVEAITEGIRQGIINL